MKSMTKVPGALAPAARTPGWLPRAHPVSWQMLGITTLAMLMISVDRQLLPTVLPAIMQEFGLDAAQGGWLSSLSFVGTLIGALVVGVLADSVGTGHRRAWSWVGACALTIGSAFATFYARSLGALQVLRFTMGMGTGAMEPVNIAVASEFWQKENRGFALGVHHTGMPLGQFVGPVLMGLILANGDWRATFLWIPLIGLPIILLQLYLGRRRNEEQVYAWIREEGLTVPVDTAAPVSRNPLTNLRQAFAERNVRLCLVMNFLFLWTEMGVATFLTYQLTSQLGLSLAEAAVISGASGLVGWAGQIFWGTLSDHRGRKFALGILTIGFSVCVALCMFIDSRAMAWTLLLAWGLFRNSPYVVLYSLAVDSSPRAAGSGLGLLIGVGLGLAGFLVGPVAGYVIEHFGWHWSYAMLALSCLLALIPLRFVEETRHGAT